MAMIKIVGQSNGPGYWEPGLADLHFQTWVA
jgi:hypothetical protein